MRSATAMTFIANWKLLPIRRTGKGRVELDLFSRKFLLFSCVRLMLVAAYFYQMYLHSSVIFEWRLVTVTQNVLVIFSFTGGVFKVLFVTNAATRMGDDIFKGETIIRAKYWIVVHFLIALYYGGLILLFLQTWQKIEPPTVRLIFGLTIASLSLQGYLDYLSCFTAVYIWIQDFLHECNDYLSRLRPTVVDLVNILEKYEKLKFGLERLSLLHFTVVQTVGIMSAFISISGKC